MPQKGVSSLRENNSSERRASNGFDMLDMPRGPFESPLESNFMKTFTRPSELPSEETRKANVSAILGEIKELRSTTNEDVGNKKFSFIEIYEKSIKNRKGSVPRNQPKTQPKRNAITPLRLQAGNTGSKNGGSSDQFKRTNLRVSSNPTDRSIHEGMHSPDHRERSPLTGNKTPVPKTAGIRSNSLTKGQRIIAEARSMLEKETKVRPQERRSSSSRNSRYQNGYLGGIGPDSPSDKFQKPSISNPVRHVDDNGLDMRRPGIMPIKESRESSEVSINSFPKKANNTNDNSKMNSSKDTEALREEILNGSAFNSKEDLQAGDFHKASGSSKLNHNKKTTSSSRAGSHPFGQGTIQNSESYDYEKTLTSPLISYTPGNQSTDRSGAFGRIPYSNTTSEHIHVQENFLETFEPNTNVKVPPSKDVFYECTSLTRLSHVPDDATSVSKEAASRNASKSEQEYLASKKQMNIDFPQRESSHELFRQTFSSHNKPQVSNNQRIDTESSQYYGPSEEVSSNIMSYNASKEIRESPDRAQLSSFNNRTNSNRSKSKANKENEDLEIKPRKSPMKDSALGQGDDYDEDFDFDEIEDEVKVSASKKNINDRGNERQNILRYTFNPDEYRNEQFENE